MYFISTDKIIDIHPEAIEGIGQIGFTRVVSARNNRQVALFEFRFLDRTKILECEFHFSIPLTGLNAGGSCCPWQGGTGTALEAVPFPATGFYPGRFSHVQPEQHADGPGLRVSAPGAVICLCSPGLARWPPESSSRSAGSRAFWQSPWSFRHRRPSRNPFPPVRRRR